MLKNRWKRFLYCQSFGSAALMINPPSEKPMKESQEIESI